MTVEPIISCRYAAEEDLMEESDVGTCYTVVRPSDVFAANNLSRTLNYAPILIIRAWLRAARAVEGALDPPHAATFLALARRDNSEMKRETLPVYSRTKIIVRCR